MTVEIWTKLFLFLLFFVQAVYTTHTYICKYNCWYLSARVNLTARSYSKGWTPSRILLQVYKSTHQWQGANIIFGGKKEWALNYKWCETYFYVWEYFSLHSKKLTLFGLVFIDGWPISEIGYPFEKNLIWTPLANIFFICLGANFSLLITL